MSPVEVIMTRIRFYEAKIVLYCLIVSFWRSWLLDLQGFKEQKCGTPKWARLFNRNKDLAVLKKHKYTVLWHKMQKHYEWNVMRKICAETSEVMLQMQECTCIRSKAHTCRNSHVVFVHRAQLDNRQFLIHCFCMSNHFMISGQILTSNALL